jgi:hypothetical protein
MLVVGVDPGVTGALAVLPVTPGCSPADVVVYDIPTVQVKIANSFRPRVDLHGLWVLMQGLAALGPDLVILEDVERGGVRAGNAGGVALGKAAGILEACITALSLPVHLVPPATWKRALRLTSDKGATRREASRLLPGAAWQWSKVKDHNRAEAALLAWYGAVKVLGGASCQ